MSRKLFRTVFQIEVLSEDESVDSLSLGDIIEAITTGDCSGETKVVSVEEVAPNVMANLLIAQGSEPTFFGLDDNGDETD